ncbi:MAG: DUF2797 domain-containing protein, partial [Draconibacterium sp.]|nr:DUF2797 domain-containing protein [Draconibacterium sp.]
IEVFLKKHFTDKTNWRAMLKNEVAQNVNLEIEKQKAIDLLPAELQKYVSTDNKTTIIEYPVQQFPQKIKSVGFDKTPTIEGVLKGIKGQYLIFENDTVLNIRKHGGYFLQIESPS